MPFGFNQKYETPTQTRTMGASLPRPFAPLVKAGGGDNIGSGDQAGGGGNLPNGCPKSVGWWWIPLGCIGATQALAWLLARR